MRNRLAHKACTVLAAVCLAAPGTPAAAIPRIPSATDAPYPGVITLEVDATDLDHRVFQVRQRIPVVPGPLTLYFPRWLPGTHGPSGTVERLAGLQVRTADQRSLAWQRDPADPFAFQVQVPAGVQELALEFQHLSPLEPRGGRVVMTREMLNLQWNTVLLYPAGHASTQIQVQSRVKLPAGWQQASALQVQATDANGITFQPVSLDTLVDSPLFAGQHVRRVPLDPPGTQRPVVLTIMADAPEQLQASEEQLQAHRAMVQQADRLFGARHFARYHFLLALSERQSGIGLEHHESSENGVRPNYFKDWAKRAGGRDLLPHEYTHSWNGKFRRPADLLTPDFNSQPMRAGLLWLYEGQTQFWGRVLAARSGLITPEQARDSLAHVAASLEHRAGRAWRNLQDTTNEGTIDPRKTSRDWSNWQRGRDYYEEAALVWLEADALIRERSGGARSLDDFAKAFFGVEDGRVQPLTYTFDDVVATLNAVEPFDWAPFLRTRLEEHAQGAPLAGLEASGWRLAYADRPSELSRNDDREDRGDDFAYSLGFSVLKEGKLGSVLWDSPAYRAGLSGALQLVAVNGRAYKAEGLAQAITANKAGKAPLALLIRDGDLYRTVTIDYRGGLRYPRLERIPGTPERLDSGVLAARPAI
jgi:predicted metalloprotease with PDZ domain